MSEVGASWHASIPIGNRAAPPLVRAPGPLAPFARRGPRFRALALTHGFAPYFLAALSEILRNECASVDMPAPAAPAAPAGAQAVPALAADEQGNDPALEPIAHDVASRGLDFLMRGTGLRRGGVNHGLIGY